MIRHGLLLVICLLGGGCSSSERPVLPPEVRTSPGERRVVRLTPGDVVEVKFFAMSELDAVQPVRPDGRISLQLVGDVVVEGKTTEELRADLIDAYGNHLRRPELAVIVQDLATREVLVGGAVRTPGPVRMAGAEMTLLEAVLRAGGFDLETAELANVVLIRHRDGKRYGGAFDLSTAIEDGSGELVLLEPRDIVWVPRTAIVEVAQWIDQHINQVVPQFGLIYTQQIGSATLSFDSASLRFRQ